MLDSYLWSLCECLVGIYVATISHSYAMLDKDKNVLTQFYKCQMYGQIVCWLKDGMKDDIIVSNKRLTELKKELVRL
jgi:hypothetical protein